MFSKLLKHEWKANANTLGILSLAALGLGIFATIAMRLILYVGPQIEDETRGLALLIVGLSMMLFFSFMALMIYVVAVQFILLFRFYKSRFTDEGYLTFTLPVTSHQIFLSSWAIMLLWMAISVVIVLTSITMFIFIGTATEGLINQDAAGELPNVWRAFTELYQILYGDNAATSVIFGLSAFVSILCSPLLIMTCITMGAVVAKKHKILAAFGIYYGLKDRHTNGGNYIHATDRGTQPKKFFGHFAVPVEVLPAELHKGDLHEAAKAKGNAYNIGKDSSQGDAHNA